MKNVQWVLFSLLANGVSAYYVIQDQGLHYELSWCCWKVKMDEDAIWMERHVGYFKGFLHVAPSPYTSLDTNRLMMVYFALSALDIMGQLDAVENRQEIIDWVYGNQVVLADRNGTKCGGFIGGGFTGPMDNEEDVTKYHQAHVSMTYCALLILTILGDDFSRVKKEAIIEGLKSIQQPDGSYQAVAFGTENDMRFVFCAAAVSFMLQDFSGMDVDKTAEFITKSQSYDGGFGILPNQETHSGAIYVAVATLKLLGRLDGVDRDSLESFLVSRQVSGFNGRINKIPDTCYTFWVVGSLQILGLQDIIDPIEARKFLMQCQSPYGGFSKHPGKPPKVFPDILHAYYSVCGMSLIREPGFAPIVSALGLTQRAFSDSPFYQESFM